MESNCIQSLSRLPDRLLNACIRPCASILQAMESIQRGGIEIALVIDPEMRVLGTVTDGDLRRAILKGASLSDPIESFMHRDFTWVGPSTGRAEILDIMRARVLKHLPALDESGRLVGLHLLREMLGATRRENTAVIMAGGRGERLRPITDTMPKPMIRVAGRPILERIVLHLVGFGIRRIFMSVNYLADVIEKHFEDGAEFGCQISYLREEQPLGTGGALSLLPKGLKEPILVLNGDLVTQFDVGNLMAFHTSGCFFATVAVHEYVHTIPYGVVESDGSCVKNLSEKPTFSWLVNAGIYVIEPHLVEQIPASTFYPMPTLIESLLDRGAGVGSFSIEEEWNDIGRPEELNRACGRI